MSKPNAVYVTYTPAKTLEQAVARMERATANQLATVLDEIAAGRSVGVFASSPVVILALQRRTAA